MKPLIVLNVVGLTPKLLAHAPQLSALAASGGTAFLEPVLPAVTCSVQASMLTGTLPREHGVVGNGWYFEELAQVWLWRQSNHLVAGDKVWDMARARNSDFRCAQMFWWFNMHSSADIAVTPRPAYLADGRKIPDIYSQPAELRPKLQAELGRFPLFNFWGPTADIVSSRWIADASRIVFDTYRPELMLVYLPHLDYNLQRLGPDDPAIRQDVAQIDAVAAGLAAHCQAQGAGVIVLSEYGIEAVSRPIHINRVLREAGLLAVQETVGGELLDAGASRAFAVADHQVAHVYVAAPADLPAVRELLGGIEGVQLLDRQEQARHGLDHPRSGQLVAVSPPGAWFTYYYWLRDEQAPDFARTVDIHNKPGYDPAELFVDPELVAPSLRVAWRLLKKSLGFRSVFDLISLDAGLVKGSHGRLPSTPEDGPLLISDQPLAAQTLPATGVADLLLERLFGPA